MIVMKFGGSSLESPEAVERVCGIVKSQLPRHPLVVVSAMGKTTNLLLELASKAARGHGYFARKQLNELQDLHYGIVDDLLHGERFDRVSKVLQNAFRELHGVIHDLSEDGLALTPRLSDHIASFGERLSSEIVAAALQERRITALHVDARDYIVTDDRHGAAAPLHWSLYARLRRSIPYLAETHVVVMGGFIGATEEGITTTLGRGGSDLTASLVGAGISAEEIQIWTDVDGMLTCDPRLLSGVHCLRRISYEEAAVMASAGAKVLHPETVRPAVRQRIPLVICNSRHPEHAGTRITAVPVRCANPVKTIAVRQNLVVLEMTSRDVVTGPEFIRILNDFCHRKNMEPALMCHTGSTVFFGLANGDVLPELELELAGCVEVRLQNDVALITLVGQGLARDSGALDRATAALRGIPATIVSQNMGSIAIPILVAQRDLRRALSQLHREFFSYVDPAAFSAVSTETPVQSSHTAPMLSFTMRKNALFSSFGLRRSS